MILSPTPPTPKELVTFQKPFWDTDRKCIELTYFIMSNIPIHEHNMSTTELLN